MRGNCRPSVSVITVAYNAASHIAGTIDSVLAQDYADIEYLIIDGASTDATPEIVRSYGNRISKVVSERDSGIYFAMNKGLQVCTGSAILFINADDQLAGPGAISSLVEARLRDSSSGPAVCFSNFIKYYPSIDKSLLVIANEEFDRGFSLCHQAMMVDRAAYDRVGEFDTSFRYAADHEWAVRAKRAGVKFINAKSPPSVIFRHGGATHVSYEASRTEGGNIILKYYGRIPYARYKLRQCWIRCLRKIAGSLKGLIGARASAAVQENYFRIVRGYRSADTKVDE